MNIKRSKGMNMEYVYVLLNSESNKYTLGTGNRTPEAFVASERKYSNNKRAEVYHRDTGT